MLFEKTFWELLADKSVPVLPLLSYFMMHEQFLLFITFLNVYGILDNC